MSQSVTLDLTRTVDLKKNRFLDSDLMKATDFFDVLLQGGETKYSIVAKYPYLMEFSVKAYYSRMEEVFEAVQGIMQKQSESVLNYFQNVDFSKFKEDVAPQEILSMFTWMADGCLRQFERAGIRVDLENLMVLFHRWVTMFKQFSYKEEFL